MVEKYYCKTATSGAPGNDANDGLSEGAPKRTLQATLTAIGTTTDVTEIHLWGVDASGANYVWPTLASGKPTIIIGHDGAAIDYTGHTSVGTTYAGTIDVDHLEIGGGNFFLYQHASICGGSLSGRTGVTSFSGVAKYIDFSDCTMSAGMTMIGDISNCTLTGGFFYLNGTIENCTLINAYISAPYPGSIRNCSIYNGYIGIWYLGNKRGGDLNIENNVFHTLSGDCIRYINGGAGPGAAKVLNNRFRNTSGDPIQSIMDTVGDAPIVLDADPFVDGPGGDLTLVESLSGLTGRNGRTIGAIQAAGSGGSTGYSLSRTVQ